MTSLHDIAETAAALGQDDLAAQIREWAGEVERLQKDAGYWRAHIGTLSASASDDLADRLDAEMNKG